jgi:hypothetical protein
MRVLMAVGLVIVLAVATFLLYVGWFMRRTVGATPQISVHLKASGEHTIEIEVSSAGGPPLAVTEISMKRAFGDLLGIAPPEGFILEPLPLTAEELRDPDAVAHAVEFNRDNIRYVGTARVPTNIPAVLVFRVERKGATAGVIDLQHERKIGMGGSIGFASVHVDAAGR